MSCILSSLFLSPESSNKCSSPPKSRSNLNFAMILISDFIQKLTPILVDSWPWVKKINDFDEQFPVILFSVAVIFFTVSCFGCSFIRFSKLGRRPPLPPGPRGLPVVGNLFSLDPELHVYFASLARRYGPVLMIRLGRKIGIVVTSTSAAREVLKDHDIVFANRDVPLVVTAMEYGGRDIVFTPYGPEWRMLRKVCVRDMLSGATLDAVYDLRRREIRRTVSYFHERAGTAVNLGERMFLTVLNIITNMLWGGTIHGGEKDAIGVEFRQVVAEVTELLGKPNISDFFSGLAWLDLQGIKKQMKGLAKRFDRIFDAVIDQRLKMDGVNKMKNGDSGIDNKDFLQVLLKLKNEGDSKTPLTMFHVKALLMDMVVGGTDTTSNTVEFAMAEIINNPRVMNKTQKELDTVIGKNTTVEEIHINKLPYLHAVIKEVLRLHPALPLMVPHCPSESRVVAGFTIPKKSRVFVNVWAIHRDPSIWENPSVFAPERFLNGKGDYSGSDFEYIPFGSGRRICAGVAMAERGVMFSVASLLHSFDWKLPEGETLDLSEKFGIVLKKKSPLVVVPVPRLPDSALYE